MDDSAQANSQQPTPDDNQAMPVPQTNTPTDTQATAQPTDQPTDQSAQPDPTTQTSTADEDLYSIGEAAQFLNVSIDTIRRWDNKGLIKAIRSPGNLRRFSKKELEAFKREAEKQDIYLTISEAAKELGVSIQTLRRW